MARDRKRQKAIEQAWRERERLRQQESRTRRQEIREEDATNKALTMTTRAALAGRDLPSRPHMYEDRTRRKAQASPLNRAIENQVDYLTNRAPASERRRPVVPPTTTSIVQRPQKSKTPALDFLYQRIRDNKPIDTNTIRLAVEQARAERVTIPIGLQQAYDDVTKYDRAANLSADALARESTVRDWQARRAEEAGILGVPVLGNAIKEGRDIVKGAPKAVLGIYQAISENTKEGGSLPDIIGGTVYDALIEPQADYYKSKYYDPISRGDWRGLLNNLEQTPISTLLDATGAYSLLSSGASRAAVGARTLGEGGTLADAYRAGKAAPPPRVLRSGDLEVRIPSSPSPSGRLMQETYDNLRAALSPESNQMRVAKAGARDMRIEHGRTIASFAADTDRVKALDSLGTQVKSVLGITSKPAAMATVVDATLPPAARGGAGLRAYAAKMRARAQQIRDSAVGAPKGSYDYVHVTSPEGASAIIREGFRTDVGGGLGPQYGPGVYLSRGGAEPGATWVAQIETMDESGIRPTQMLKADADLGKTLRVEAMRPNLQTGYFRTVPVREQLQRADPSLLAKFDDAVASGLDEQQALGKVARESGYDSIVRELKDWDEEVIVFDPKRVKFQGAKRPLTANDRRTIADLEAQATRLERAAASASKVDADTLSAIERLSTYRQDVLIESGRLNRTTALLRQNLMGERLGLLDPRVAEVTAKLRSLIDNADDPVAILDSPEVLQLTDELAALNSEIGAGVYVGEVATDAPKTLSAAGKTRPGYGKTREVRGVGKQNTGALFEQGRVRLDPNRVLEDFQDIWRYEYANRVKADLLKLGEPIGPEGPKPGYVVINPEGAKVPRRWRDAPREGQWTAEGMSKEQVASDLEEYARNIIGATDRAGANPVVDAARRAEQDLSTLRQVPAAVASRYFQEYTGKPGVFFGSAGKAAKTYDVASDLVRASVIYASPGYIPANLVSNLGMLTGDAGFWAPKDLISAANFIYRRGDRVKDLVPLIRNEMQSGPSKALIQGDNVFSGGLKKLIGVTTDIPDALPRTAAWIHHAKKAGFKTPERMRALLTDPRYRDQLNHVREQANNAMGDFERVTSPAEKAWVQRILFVYPWLKASARWPFTFARDYPAKAAFAAHASLEAERDPKYDLPVNAPNYLSDLIGMGGITDGQFRGINPRSVTWLTTIPGLADTGARAIKGEANTSFLDVVRPELRALANIVAGTNQYGERVGAAEAAKQAGLGLVPSINTAKEFINPRGELPAYVGDKDRSRLGVVKLRVLRGMVPVWYDAASVADAAARQKKGGKTLEDKQSESVQKWSEQYGETPDEEITGLLNLSAELDELRRAAYDKYKDEVQKKTGRRPRDLSDEETSYLALQATAELYLRVNPNEDPRQTRTDIQEATGDLQYTKYLLEMYRKLLGLDYLEKYSRALSRSSP